MYVGRYKTKDLHIQMTGDTKDTVCFKIQEELDWFNKRFPAKHYPKTFRASSVAFTQVTNN